MIPKIIHYIWFSGEEKPELIKRCVDSWKKVLVDYEIKEWTLKDVEQIRKDNKYLDQALNNKKWSWASDFLRLWILYNVGGIYLDSDVEVLKPFDKCLNDGFFTCYEFKKSIEAAVMGSEKGNRFAKEFLDLYANRDFDDELKKGQPEIIPIILADYINEKYKIYKARRRHTIIDSLHIYPYYYFSPKNKFKNRIQKNKKTIAIHHFNGAWFEKNNEKRSLYVKFKHQVFYFLESILSYKQFKKFVQHRIAVVARRKKRHATRRAKKSR